MTLSVEASNRNKVCLVVSSIMTARAFLLDQIIALSKTYRVYLVANTDDLDFFRRQGIDAVVLPVPIERKMSPVKDFLVLYRLWRLFRKERFSIIHSISPKAGLLAMLAGRLACVPVRIHIFTGQVWATRRGISRVLLKRIDRFLASLATHILVDSRSQREFLLSHGVIKTGRSAVLCKGSVCGVDGQRFRPDPAARARVRGELGIAADAIVFLYLGRINRDKGVLDLTAAFAEIGRRHPQAHLLIVGPDEDGIKLDIQKAVKQEVKRLHLVDYTDCPEQYMAAADVFCLPSYREGFGLTIIEAAAVGIPAVASRIYGITDAVEEDVTGVLHIPGDRKGLRQQMEKLVLDPTWRRQLGENARKRALRDFSKEVLTLAWLDYYARVNPQYNNDG